MNPIRAWTQKKHPHSKAQAFVEFAIIIPILLLVLTGIIEFGYAFYTWAAISEVARIGTRYAVTGQYDPQYCPAAAAALTYECPRGPTWPPRIARTALPTVLSNPISPILNSRPPPCKTGRACPPRATRR